MKNKRIIIVLILGVVFFVSGVLIREYPTSYDPVLSKESSILGEENVVISKSPDFAETEVKVAKVFDGDTIETSLGEKIRYLGINAAEEGEPFFREALKFNENLVLGKSIKLELDVQSKDRHGRTLAYVFINEKHANLEMVKNGFAIIQTIQPNVKYQDEILGAQRTARENCLGLWKELCSQSPNSCINIASIYQDAPGNDNQNKNGEWIEIKNVCTSSISMEGWLLKDSSASNRYKFKNFSLDNGKIVFVYSGCGEDSEDKLYWQCPEGKYAIWNNTGDHGFLYNKKEELVSDYEY